MTKTETLPQNLLLDYSELSDISEQDRQFANDYVESVRAAYRDGAEYRGRRTPEQIEIANQQSLKAENLIVDYLSAFNLTDHLDERVGGLENGLELKQMVDAWRHLWVGFAVITNRIARDDTRHKYNIKEISELNNKEYMLVMQKLFNDFQEHNALRFGSETAGVRRKKELREFGLPVFDEEGNKLYEKFDPDKPPTALELGRRALRVGYETTGPKPVKNSQNTNGDQVTYMHTAGKISPEELRQLRREFFSHMPLPEEFYTKVGGMKNIPSTLENIGK